MTAVTFSRFQNGRCDVRLGGEVVGFVGKSAKHYMGTYVVGFHGEGQITYADSLKDAKAIAAQIHAAREQFAREEDDRAEREKALADIRVAQRRLQNAATAEERQRAYNVQSGLVRHVASTLGVDAAIALGREADRLNRAEDEAAEAAAQAKAAVASVTEAAGTVAGGTPEVEVVRLAGGTLAAVVRYGKGSYAAAATGDHGRVVRRFAGTRAGALTALGQALASAADVPFDEGREPDHLCLACGCAPCGCAAPRRPGMTPMQRMVRNALIQAEVACECSLADYLNYVLGAAARHEADCRRLARIRDWAEARSGRTGADYLPAGGARIAAAA